ncbi:MAG: response regulator transcription factor [Chloroflexota bacterium]|nr:response regulator transcription factor [Chloroflexota bacterium]
MDERAPETLRILLVDDHPMVREGLRALLAAQPDMRVVGECDNGEDAVARALALQPDLILMDIQMPGVNGIEATRRIMRDSPHVAVLALTMLEDDESVFGAMRAGARGYLLKGAGKDEVRRAIISVAHGEAMFSPQIAQRLAQYFANMRPVVPREAFPELTEREREVLALIVDGKTNAQIASLLTLSPKTVSNHISNIFSKLQVLDRAQAVTRARQSGMDGSA